MTIHLVDIDHVGIAVDDLEGSVERYRAMLGVEPVLRERVEDQGVDEVLFAVGSSFIQLLGAVGPDSPVGRSLATRGPGLHHVAYRVRDLAAALEDLSAQGARLVDRVPRQGSRNTLIAFVHPRSMGGVLLELRPLALPLVQVETRLAHFRLRDSIVGSFPCPAEFRNAQLLTLGVSHHHVPRAGEPEPSLRR